MPEIIINSIRIHPLNFDCTRVLLQVLFFGLKKVCVCTNIQIWKDSWIFIKIFIISLHSHRSSIDQAVLYLLINVDIIIHF